MSDKKTHKWVLAGCLMATTAAPLAAHQLPDAASIRKPARAVSDRGLFLS